MSMSFNEYADMLAAKYKGRYDPLDLYYDGLCALEMFMTDAELRELSDLFEQDYEKGLVN